MNDDIQVVATLQVVIRKDVKFESSAMMKVDKNHYFLIIRPEGDEEAMKSLHLRSDRAALQSIIAHELGHFVAGLFEDKTHMGQSDVLPAEKKAWEIAEKIAPIKKVMRDRALEDYAKVADEEMKDRQESILQQESQEELRRVIYGN